MCLPYGTNGYYIRFVWFCYAPLCWEWSSLRSGWKRLIGFTLHGIWLLSHIKVRKSLKSPNIWKTTNCGERHSMRHPLKHQVYRYIDVFNIFIIVLVKKDMCYRPPKKYRICPEFLGTLRSRSRISNRDLKSRDPVSVTKSGQKFDPAQLWYRNVLTSLCLKEAVNILLSFR